MSEFVVRPIGVVRSGLKSRAEAPMQGREGAPSAWVEILPAFATALDGLAVGAEVVLLTWLHQAHREVLRVRPRSDPDRAERGVFSTRSPDRPNPIGLHPVTILEVSEAGLRVEPLEAIDGTPVLDIKPVLRS